MAKGKTKIAHATLELRIDGRVATITLNRPERLNAIDDAMPREIGAAPAIAARGSDHVD